MSEADVRQVTDSGVLAALASPARRRLFDLLRVDGPATTGQLAESAGLAVGSVSHHIRTLVRAGLVVEAPELARTRRESWWKPAVQRVVWEPTELASSPAGEVIVAAAEALSLDRQLGLARQWLTGRDERPEWAEAAFSTDTWLTLTADELVALRTELHDVLDRYRQRHVDDPSTDRRDVFLFARGFPARP